MKSESQILIYSNPSDDISWDCFDNNDPLRKIPTIDTMDFNIDMNWKNIIDESENYWAFYNQKSTELPVRYNFVKNSDEHFYIKMEPLGSSLGYRVFLVRHYPNVVGRVRKRVDSFRISVRLNLKELLEIIDENRWTTFDRSGYTYCEDPASKNLNYDLYDPEVPE